MPYTEQDRARDRAAHIAELRAEQAELAARGFDYSARVIAERIADLDGDDD